MFHTLKQYLTSSNNSDIYSSHHHDNWRKQKNHHLGNWLQDMTRPFGNTMPMYENEQRFFWKRGRNKKNKYYMDPYYDNQHAMMYGNDDKRLRNKSSHKSLSSFFRINRHDDYPQYYNSSEHSHQHSRRSSQPNNQYNPHSVMNNTNTTATNRRQRHNSLPSTVNRSGQQSNMNGGNRNMTFDPMSNTAMNGNGMNAPGYNPMMQHQYPYQQQQQHNPYYQQQSMYDEPLMNHHLKKQTYNNGHMSHNNNGHVQQQNERHRRSLSNGQSMYSPYGQSGMYMDPNYYYQQQQQPQYNNYYPNNHYNNNRNSLKMFR